MQGGAIYDANGASLPRSGAKVVQLLNADKGAKALLTVKYRGDTGVVRVRIFQGPHLLEEWTGTGGGFTESIPLFTIFEKKVKIVIVAITQYGVSNIVVEHVNLTVEAFDYPLLSGEYMRNGGSENAGSMNSWRLGGGASYNGAKAASGARSMKLVGVSSVRQRFDVLTESPYVLSCKVRGETRLMNLSIQNMEEIDERFAFIDQSKSAWKRWAKLYRMGSAWDEDVVVESSAGGFGYVDDCSLKRYDPVAREGSVVGSQGLPFYEPLAGNQWIRNGGL